MYFRLPIHYFMYAVCCIVYITATTDWHLAGINIAYGKPASQGPFTYYDTLSSGIIKYYTADLAVDGKTYGMLKHGSCTHTKGSSLANAYWKVDLQKAYRITGIIIYNRKGYERRLKNFIIYGNGTEVIYNSQGSNEYRESVIHIPLDEKRFFSSITVQLPANDGYSEKGMYYLTLCEVEIYAVVVQSFSINGYSTLNNVTVDEHDADLQFICIVGRYPASTIKISFNGDILVERLNEMSLSFIRPVVACLDAGVYICEAKDEYGNIQIKKITLFVKCSPRPFRQAPSNFTSNLHVHLKLSLNVIAYPEPGPKGFSWYMYKNGGVGWTWLLGNSDLKISSTGLQSNLTLLNVSKEDFGRYKVIATNTIGRYTQQWFVFQNVSETYKQYTDSETCRRESDSLALIVGVTLGVICFLLAICLTYYIIAYKRKCRQDRTSFNRPPKTSTHANPAFAPAAEEPEEQCNNDSTSKEGPLVQEYTDPFRYANTDKDIYDEIETA